MDTVGFLKLKKISLFFRQYDMIISFDDTNVFVQLLRNTDGDWSSFFQEASAKGIRPIEKLSPTFAHSNSPTHVHFISQEVLLFFLKSHKTFHIYKLVPLLCFCLCFFLAHIFFFARKSFFTHRTVQGERGAKFIHTKSTAAYRKRHLTGVTQWKTVLRWLLTSTLVWGSTTSWFLQNKSVNS